MKDITTLFKFWMTAYNAKIREEYEGKLTVAVFASTEKEAIDKAKTLVDRTFFEVTEVAELINDSK